MPVVEFSPTLFPPFMLLGKYKVIEVWPHMQGCKGYNLSGAASGQIFYKLQIKGS